jgi:hypothetical protein
LAIGNAIGYRLLVFVCFCCCFVCFWFIVYFFLLSGSISALPFFLSLSFRFPFPVSSSSFSSSF